METLFQNVVISSYSDDREAFSTALDTLDEIRANDDKSQVPVLVTLLRWARGAELIDFLAQAISELTGGEFVDDEAKDWKALTEWLGLNSDEYKPPPGLITLKAGLYAALIHPNLGLLLATAEQTSIIDPVQIAWGGVVPDGIPPLETAPTIPADEADYLLDDDRVFGVSINGEHRAYPLRIINAHEMANDELGGEPIALAY